MIDVDLQLTVTDGQRRFDLSVRFVTDAPFAALYGPSGSGKTLTLQAIAGLLKPSGGHIRINGRTLYDSATQTHMPTMERRVGYLFQDYALFPHLSVRKNVEFGLSSWRSGVAEKNRARVDALLKSFDLSAMADSRPGKLSGGQQQRVALARALACEPQILLLDEPFASLNPMLRESLRQELAEVRRQWGIPALMITHDVEDVLALADVAFVYERGQIAKEVNLHTAESREFKRAELGLGTVADTPLRARLRQLLQGPAA